LPRQLIPGSTPHSTPVSHPRRRMPGSPASPLALGFPHRIPDIFRTWHADHSRIPPGCRLERRRRIVPPITNQRKSSRAQGGSLPLTRARAKGQPTRKTRQQRPPSRPIDAGMQKRIDFIFCRFRFYAALSAGLRGRPSETSFQTKAHGGLRESASPNGVPRLRLSRGACSPGQNLRFCCGNHVRYVLAYPWTRPRPLGGGLLARWLPHASPRGHEVGKENGKWQNDCSH
jgi:hypothetical protein